MAVQPVLGFSDKVGRAFPLNSTGVGKPGLSCAFFFPHGAASSFDRPRHCLCWRQLSFCCIILTLCCNGNGAFAMDSRPPNAGQTMDPVQHAVQLTPAPRCCVCQSCELVIRCARCIRPVCPCSVYLDWDLCLLCALGQTDDAEALIEHGFLPHELDMNPAMTLGMLQEFIAPVLVLPNSTHPLSPDISPTTECPAAPLAVCCSCGQSFGWRFCSCGGNLSFAQNGQTYVMPCSHYTPQLHHCPDCLSTDRPRPSERPVLPSLNEEIPLFPWDPDLGDAHESDGDGVPSQEVADDEALGTVADNGTGDSNGTDDANDTDDANGTHD